MAGPASSTRYTDAAFIVFVTFVVPLFKEDAVELRNKRLADRTTGFSHGFNCALQSGFVLEQFDGGFDGGYLSGRMEYVIPEGERRSLLCSQHVSEDDSLGEELDWLILQVIEHSLSLSIKLWDGKRGNIQVIGLGIGPTKEQFDALALRANLSPSFSTPRR